MQKVIVFQQNNSGESKIAGIEKYGEDLFSLKRININENLPILIENSSEFLPNKIEADIVLDYLKHPDLSFDLALLCIKEKIPLIASSKKIKGENIFIPPTCCGLAKNKILGDYGFFFGAPEFKVVMNNNIIQDIKILRGAPCGATWEAAKKVKGLNYIEACRDIGLKTQFFCTADPAGWDPLFGKSPVHFAADIHSAALMKAIKKKSPRIEVKCEKKII
ncbi:MAG: hypothetical protein JRJ49_01285 [Deltaproteobacteria bacterium]|nr:hypothetical protein [Deltaproteobacteria bacterium]